MTELVHTVRDQIVRRLASATRPVGKRAGQSILIIQPDHLGDILLSQPAVRAIRCKFPDRRIVGAVGPWSEHIARRTWDVDEIMTFAFPAFDRQRSRQSILTPYTALADAARVLSEVDPDTIYVLRTDDWWSAWVASMIAAGDVVTARDRRMDPFATCQVELDGINHTSARALAIAGFGNAGTNQCDVEISYPENAEVARKIRDLLDGSGVPRDYLVVHPGAGADVKTWPIASWRTVIQEHAGEGHHVVVTGTAEEASIAHATVIGIDGATSIAGQTDLDGLAEVLRHAQLVVGPDSGPLHLAVACKTPTVHLFGPSDPEKFGPWGPADRHRIVSAGWSCGSCGDLSTERSAGCGCMLTIQPDDVLNVIRAMVTSHAA